MHRVMVEVEIQTIVLGETEMTMNRQHPKCYMYMRVSTDYQVEGYSLDAQHRRMEEFAEYREMEVAGVYCDAGRSGKSIKGRPEFQKMMDDISSQKDGISYVLVFKLSRFGRNASDVLKSIQFLNGYDIDLVSVEEGIDSSTQGGRLMLSLLSAVAEIERVNIQAQFMAGKRQSIKEGNWPGGPAPFGYRKGKEGLVQDKDEADMVRQIYELFLQPEMNYTALTRYLNGQGAKRRSGNEMIPLSCGFVKRILSSPFYCGKLLYNGDCAEEEKRISVPGRHEAIVSEDIWNEVREKREAVRQGGEKAPGTEYVSVLAGLVKCPVCGRAMAGYTTNKINWNHGGMYKPMHYYVCKYHGVQYGRACSYKGHLNQEKVDGAVLEIVSGLTLTKTFQDALMRQYGGGEDREKVRETIEGLKQKLHELRMKQRNLGSTLDSLDVFLDDYDERYDAIQQKIDDIYDEADHVEKRLARIKSLEDEHEKARLSADRIRRILEDFKALYGRMSGSEKRMFYRQFISRIDVLPEADDGRIIKSITFNFPISLPEGGGFAATAGGERFSCVIDCTGTKKTAAESKPTYAQIKAYILNQHGAKVSSLYIAQMKKKYGLETGKAYNRRETGDRVPKCPKEKEAFILEAFKFFRMVPEQTEIIEQGGEQNG